MIGVPYIIQNEYNPNKINKTMASKKTFPAWILLMTVIFITSCRTAQDEPISQPNVLIIFIDDFGWPGIGCYGNSRVETPNIDRIAVEGMKFTDAYVNPQCTPTRASLLTGQHTARLRMWHVIGRYGFPYARMHEPPYRENLPAETYTLAEALRDNGYRTALLGKWHLSTWSDRYPVPDGYYTTLFQEGKDKHGFDYVDIARNPNYHQTGDKGVDYLTDEAIQFMEEKSDKPFFIYLSHHTIHGPVLAPEPLVQKYLDLGYPEEGQWNATYLAAIEHMDHSVGRLLDQMKTLGLENNTIVMFYTDNGGVEKFYSNAPLRAGKGSAYEGGIRVPLMVRWPGKIEAGAVSNLPVHVTDIYPTFLELTGTEKKKDWILDGISVAPELLGRKMDRERELFWYMPLYDYQWGATPSAVIRTGDYKLIKSFGDYYDHHTDTYVPEGRVELYNLAEDLGETHDLSAEDPEMAKILEERLMLWIVEEMHAPLPVENPEYDRARIFERSNDFNFEPFFEHPLPDIRLRTGEALKFPIPRPLVADYDDEGYNLKVDPEPGSDWPEWLVYNYIDQALLGTPPAAGEWTLILTATDPYGARAEETLHISVE